MLIKISTDIWRDVFDFLSPTDRSRLSLEFNEVSDREFSDLCQKWLHEWVKNVCLEKLWIDSDWDNKSALLINLTQEEEVPFAEVEKPDNINDLEGFRISHLDTSVLNFLRRMQPLFRDVNLNFYFDEDEESLEASRTVLTHLMPLFSDGGIEFLRLISEEQCSNQLLLTIRDNFQAQYLGIKILSMPSYTASVDEFVELFLPWLGTRRADGQPRTLSMQYDVVTVMEIVERIRQDFLDPTSGPISFFIILWFWKNFTPFRGITESTTQNAGEQLVIGKPKVERCSVDLVELQGQSPPI